MLIQTQETPSLPSYVREADLIGSRRKGGQRGILPFSSPTLWRMVKEGRFPKPVKLGERITAWDMADVRAWLDSFKKEG